METEMGAETAYCRACGTEIRRAAEICPACGVRQLPQAGVSGILDGRNPLIAAVLTMVFPGLGHIYARQVDTGLFFAVSFVLALFSLLILIGFILVPAIWLYAIFDAAKAAERRDREFTDPGPQ